MNSTTARIFGLTAAYGLFYSLLGEPHFAFTSSLDPFYFAMSTMSGNAYGDIVPLTDTAKALVMSQQALLIGNVVYALVG